MLSTLFALAQAAGDDPGLSLGGILSDIPHDAPAIFVYILVAVAIGAVIRAGRKSEPDRSDGTA